MIAPKRRESEFPPTEESGLQTPPTRDTPIIQNRGYKPLLQKITIPFPEEMHVDDGVFSLHPFLFLLLKQQKPGRLCFQRVSVWVHVV